MSDDGAALGAEERSGRVTVAGLAANGGALLRGVHVPNPDVAVDAVAIYDPTRGHDVASGSLLASGALLLGVGLVPGAPETARVLADAAGQGVVAVALIGTAEEVLAAAPSAGAGVALFAVTPGAAWAHVHLVARMLTSSGGADGEFATPYQDLFAVANAVAARAGGPVTIEDADSRLLAFSSPQDHVDARRLETILGRATPDEYQRGMRRAGIFRRLAESDAPVLLTADRDAGLRARLATAIKAGDEVLGYLWVSEGEQPLGEEAALASTELAPVVALHLLRVIAVGSAERNRRRDLAAAALDGAWSADHAVELDLRRGERLVVTCLAPERAEGHDEWAYLSERACQIVEVHMSTYRVRGIATRRGERVYCILPTADADAAAYQRAFARELLEKVAVSLRTPFRAGVGEAVRPHELRRCRAEAETALRTSQLLPLAEGVVHIDDVRDRALLIALRDMTALQPLLERGSIARMLEHDRAHGSAHVESLRAFLDHDSSIPAAARALHVHVNTLRYRLGRLAEIFALDLDDPHERLALSLQLWLLPQADAPRKDADEH